MSNDKPEDKPEEIQVDVIVGRKTHLHLFHSSGQRALMVDQVVVEHRDKNGVLIKRHVCNSGLIHKLLVKLKLAHNSLNAQGIADMAQWIGGLSSPTAYAYLGIGTETSVDTQTDVYNSNEAIVLMRSVTPTVSTGSLTNDTLTWTHVFSHANDASLTGTTAVREVAVGTAASTWRTLIHISGSNYAAAADSCNWDNGDTLTITVTCKCEQGS